MASPRLEAGPKWLRKRRKARHMRSRGSVRRWRRRAGRWRRRSNGKRPVVIRSHEKLSPSSSLKNLIPKMSRSTMRRCQSSRSLPPRDFDLKHRKAARRGARRCTQAGRSIAFAGPKAADLVPSRASTREAERKSSTPKPRLAGSGGRVEPVKAFSMKRPGSPMMPVPMTRAFSGKGG